MGSLLETLEKNRFIPIAKKGYSINIKPENKGKLTAKAKRAGMGVQAFARKVLANKEDYNQSTEKQAQFSVNSTKWRKR